MTLEHTQPDLKALPGNALVRQKDLIELRLIPFSRATLWRLIKAGRFPKPIKISDSVTAWRVTDLNAWLCNPSGYQTPNVVASTPRGKS